MGWGRQTQRDRDGKRQTEWAAGGGGGGTERLTEKYNRTRRTLNAMQSPCGSREIEKDIIKNKIYIKINKFKHVKSTFPGKQSIVQG